MHQHRHVLLHKAYQKKDLHGLQVSVLTRSIGISMLDLYQPLFLLTAGLSLRNLMLFYAWQWIFALLFCLLAGRISVRLGFSRSMLSGLIMYAVYLILFATAPATNYLTLIPAALAWGYYESVYWPNYHHYFCCLTDEDSRGSETGFITVANSISQLLAPVLGGFIITLFGFHTMFALAIAAIVLSGIPFFKSTIAHTIINESPKLILKDLISPHKNMQRTFFFSLGAIWMTTAVVWPIIVYKQFADFSQIGIFTSAVILLSTIATYFFSKKIDYLAQDKVLIYANSIYSIGWLLRSVIFNKYTFMVADFTARIGETFSFIPSLTVTYNLRDRQDHSSFQLQRTMSLSLGYIFIAAIASLWTDQSLPLLLAATPLFCLVVLITTLKIR